MNHDQITIQATPIRPEEQGFTLLEVIIALSIMVMAFTSILAVEGGSIQASARTRQMTIVGMLAKNQMIEQEYKMEGKSFHEIPKEETGIFPEPFQEYQWKTTLREIDIPTLPSNDPSGSDQNRGQSQGQIAELMTKQVSRFLSKSIREVTVSILWNTSKTPNTPAQSFSLTTYWIDLNHEFNISE